MLEMALIRLSTPTATTDCPIHVNRTLMLLAQR